MFLKSVRKYFGLFLTSIFLLSICFNSNLFAQNNASISGRVIDRNQAVIEGATVIAINTASDTEITTVTDGSGDYTFSNLSPGIYRVIVRKGGFSEAAETFTITTGQNVTGNFEMAPGSLQAEVTVTAAKGLRATGEVPQTVTVVTKSEIEERRPVGISDAYDKSPSTLGTDPNPFRTRPQIRGLQSSRILVTVDGERLNNARQAADFVGVSPSLVDITQIESVELVAGSGSSLYGSDAIGGTVNLITRGAKREKNGRRLGVELGGDYGSNNNYRRGNFALNYGENKFGIRLNLGRFIYPNYHMGSEAIDRADVIRFGEFANQASSLTPQGSLIQQYVVYDYPGGGEVLNSQARGNIGGLDFQVYPNDKQTVRFRFSTNRYRDLGVGFSPPPTGINQATTGFSNFDKGSLRYEVREITDWFTRMQLSVFYQNYRRSLNENRYAIVNGSSFFTPPGPPGTPSVFTGNPSEFVISSTPLTINDNDTTGGDFQFNFLPFSKFIYTTGLNFNVETNHDTFTQTTFKTTPPSMFDPRPLGAIIGQVAGRNTPDSTYTNVGWYNQFEYFVNKYFRAAGGFRVDNWKTEAEQTDGFPIGNVSQIILRALPLIESNPQGFDVAGVQGFADFLSGGGSLETNNTIVTFNVGGTFFIPGGVNPYVRYSTSYREPDITSRFLVRNFVTLPFFSFPGLVNTNLQPEKGRDIDVGVKISRNRIRGAASYYFNELRDATGTALGGTCIDPTGIPGIVPTPPGFGCPLPPAPPTHLVQLFQTVNFSRIVIRGVEAEIEGDITVGDYGSLTPYLSFSTIKATNRNPDASRLAVVSALYNSSAPLELDGGPDDVPFYALPNWQFAFSPRFTTSDGRWWAEYEWRKTSRITRVDPNQISFPQTTQYYFFASYEGLDKMSIRGGYRIKDTDNFKMKLTLGVENLQGKTYFSLFQPSPAVGRTFLIGTNIEFSRLFK